MSYTIETEDMRLIRQSVINCHAKIEVLNNNETIMDSIEGIINGGSSNIDGSSDIRRTCSFTIVPTYRQEIKVNETSNIWINKSIKMQIGIEDLKTGNIKWWSQGYYVFTDTSGTYDVNTNTLQVNCADFMALLDGLKNGVLGQYQIIIPAYEEDSDTGEVLSYNYIRDAMLYTVGQLGRISKMQIEDIGEYKGLESRNPGFCIKEDEPTDSTIQISEVNLKIAEEYFGKGNIQIGDYVIASGYMKYRFANITWNSVPYDLEYSSGTTVLDILTSLRDLYPNYEAFFDENNVFVCRMKPSGYDEAVVLTDSQIQSILVSENTESSSLSLTDVKNISEVWGDVIEADYYTESGVTYSNNVYFVPNAEYYDSNDPRYFNGDIVAFKVPSANSANPYVNIQNLGAIPIYDGENIRGLSANVLISGRTYTFKIKRTYENGQYITHAVYLGQYQPHAMTVLLDKEQHNERYITNTGVEVELYSPEYFYELYDVSPSALTRVINPDSPFTIEKIGSILSVDNNSNCVSDDLAMAQSNYNNFLTTRLTDNITITTLLIPFLDVNIKVEYKPKNSDETNQYIIDTISHDFENGISKITMHRFYPLYSWI